MNGASRIAGLSVLALAAGLHAQREAAPAPVPPKLARQLPEVVLSNARGDVPLRDFGLGNGGVADERGVLAFRGDDGCVTPGGVEVQCRSVGVKLTFPSGRELLVGPDGSVHLRDGEVGGPFPAGCELWLGDGSRVRIVLAQSRRDRVRDVYVIAGERALAPWLKGGKAGEVVRARDWAGVRVACCGDGGELYRPYALGPLLVLDRVLVPDARVDETPAGRLVLLTEPLQLSLETMQRQHREPKVVVRRAIAAVASVADRADAIFPAGAALQRAEQDELRWSLPQGFEIELDLQGPLAPRLMLFTGQAPKPMVEWTLGAASAAYLANPDEEQAGKRWHGNGTRLPASVPELQVREHLQERPHALAVIRRLLRRG